MNSQRSDVDSGVKRGIFARLFRELKKKKVFDNRPESLQAVGKPIEEHKKCG